MQTLASADSTAKRERRLRVVRAGFRMRHTEWAIHAFAVAELDLIVGWLQVLIVAPLAEVVRAKAMK